MSTDVLSLSINLPFVDELYQQYQADPASVDPSWRRFFENGASAPFPVEPPAKANGPQAARAASPQVGRSSSLGAALAEAAAAYPAPLEATPITAEATADERFARVYALVNAYRVRGHLEAKLDPLDHLAQPHHSDLDPKTWGFTDEDLARHVPSGGLFGVHDLTLGDLLARLRATYCGHLGVEMMHITETERRAWLQQRMEPTLNQPTLDRDTQVYILDRVAAAEAFERFVHTKYVGTKRFSLEGSETLIPLLDLVLERGGILGIEEAVIGMAHRGRLNVLVNLMGKRAADVFAEFEDVDPEKMFGGGDVKYHLGFSSDRVTRSGQKQHLTLAFNPSHLEAVDPVVVGRVRAKQRRRTDARRERVLGILVHGDAAFAGQGLVAETLNLSQLRGYRTGGTVHVIVNNQIGFTTAPAASRSTQYCTDIAKAVQVPIFHVNGDDPEAVAQAVRLAMDYRREFQSDVVIDMFCFRKYGHNEGDEPAFTQPSMYRLIESHPTVREVYSRELEKRGVITRAEADAIVAKQQELLDAEFARTRTTRPAILAMRGYWIGYQGGPDTMPEVDTSVPRETLTMLSEKITSLPEGFRAHPKIVRLLQQRAQMGRGDAGVDWGMGEALAFGSLINEGNIVRLTGQDSRRGTFSHRHSVVVDQRTEEEYLPLAHVREGGGFRIYDSPLSEAAVLGFEFGYSLDYPDGLVMWEAQFGDFVNGAQVIIDQFITSSEDKWKRLSGLVLLLPHGFEGQGPEHSSARFERFLELAAEDNVQVCYPTTPAQYFHLLRRQVYRKLRKPLIVMTPKSLLRLPAARSPIEELVDGRFQRILHDPRPPAPDQVRRVVLCTGKIYYELDEERKRRGDRQTAIVRLEQLY
ncbi:MAG TPA: 2-oxoglutarate dehydrogenase E1 component, partial [Polyangia bacterium]|nr:2-oxoglutarate dehydrogenase E1 component [Polyangia bacterium]